jgi:hypothetical protein
MDEQGVVADDLVDLELRAAVLEEEGYIVTAVGCPLTALKYDVSRAVGQKIMSSAAALARAISTSARLNCVECERFCRPSASACPT